ncbi:hypothetical protein [Methanogenium cariaci]|uniref:hypothetical protein n=1 Tax=Methanogenium cariaci TaxID=2197 RepID=UPI0007812B7A|nr:hypothetical protein [Methanogenium cariaci]
MLLSSADMHYGTVPESSGFVSAHASTVSRIASSEYEEMRTTAPCRRHWVHRWRHVQQGVAACRQVSAIKQGDEVALFELFCRNCAGSNMAGGKSLGTGTRTRTCTGDVRKLGGVSFCCTFLFF